MNMEIDEYRKMAASEAALALSEDTPAEERDKHFDNMLKLNTTYMDLLKSEHEYNNPYKEKRERSCDMLKTVINGMFQLVCYGGVAAISGYVDTHDRLPGAVLKETWKKVRFK